MDRQIEVRGAEQPAESTAGAERRESGWKMVAAGAVGVLLGAATVFLSIPREAQVGTTVAPEDTSLRPPAAVVVTSGTVRPPPSLAERVPGLTSDLVAFGFTPSGQAVIQQWFINATEPRTIDVPFGFAIPDISGRWIAALANQRYGDSLNLHVGNATYQEAIATGVGSVVWSVDQPGRVAWTERTTEGVIALDRMMEPGGTSVFELPVPSDARLVWLDGERLTLTTGGSIVSLQPDGTEVARLGGGEVVTARDGWAVASTEGALWLIDTDLDLRAPLPDGSCGDAQFSRAPATGTIRLALVCETTTGPLLEILGIDVSTLAFTSLRTLTLTEPRPVNWLDGDRFVAVPQQDPVSRPRSTILILDVDTGQVTELQWPGAVLGVIGTR